ncbi:hypothetical protein F383_38159 [Gossypium arboreum]|uniref:Uncharacterized protein n=1 Tax=Gossypium arboreum TaxID=29729 RepID=A0A0B0ME49_GOSAR|nr:hypothetical protein F383_38159 [Gossypium arboreum]
MEITVPYDFNSIHLYDIVLRGGIPLTWTCHSIALGVRC